MKTRRRFTAEFKAKVALEAIQGQPEAAGVWRRRSRFRGTTEFYPLGQIAPVGQIERSAAP